MFPVLCIGRMRESECTTDFCFIKVLQVKCSRTPNTTELNLIYLLFIFVLVLWLQAALRLLLLGDNNFLLKLPTFYFEWLYSKTLNKLIPDSVTCTPSTVK